MAQNKKPVFIKPEDVLALRERFMKEFDGQITPSRKQCKRALNQSADSKTAKDREHRAMCVLNQVCSKEIAELKKKREKMNKKPDETESADAPPEKVPSAPELESIAEEVKKSQRKHRASRPNPDETMVAQDADDSERQY